MAESKNYKVAVIGASPKQKNTSGNHELHIVIELNDWKQNETIGVGAVSLFDEKGKHIESLKYDDNTPHLSRRMGGTEKYRRKTFVFPMGDKAYNQVKEEATITMIVAENGEEHHEKLPMKNGMYSWKMEQTLKGEANQ